MAKRDRLISMDHKDSRIGGFEYVFNDMDDSEEESDDDEQSAPDGKQSSSVSNFSFANLVCNTRHQQIQ